MEIEKLIIENRMNELKEIVGGKIKPILKYIPDKIKDAWGDLRSAYFSFMGLGERYCPIEISSEKERTNNYTNETKI